MEALYAKLYNKYTKLKKEKESQFDKLNHDQEVKFLNFAAAADEMIQYLKSENDRLYAQVDELKSELTSIRASSDEQHVQCQKLLSEEQQKSKESNALLAIYEELSEEISRLQKAEHNEYSHCNTSKEIGCGQENSHDTPSEENHDTSVSRLMKKRKSTQITEGTAVPCVDVELDRPADQHACAPPSIQQPACCQRKIYGSGGDVTDTSSFSCMFQYLVEFVVGMKVSVLTQSNELCILALHQSSGYSFSLTWITNSKGK